MVGFDSKNKSSLPNAFSCLKCLLILRHPYQLDCGHRMCRTCVDSIEESVIKCPDCSEETGKSEILPDRGFQNDMKNLPIECSLCEWTGPYKEYEEHLMNLHPHPSCPYCQTQFDSIDTVLLHQKEECKKITISCPFAEYGCRDSVLRVAMPEHYLTTEHQTALMNFLLRAPKKSANKLKMDSASPLSTPMSTTTAPRTDATTSKMQEVYEMINVLAGGIQALNDDTQRLKTELIRQQSAVDSLTQELSSLKLSVREQSTSLNGIESNQDILHQDVASLKQKIDDQQNMSYDGTFSWKISSFREKMMNAQSERQTSIYSPPFYSSPTGYKMRAQLYPNGDGNARGSHLSLFFVLMRGPNDAILKFPFSYKVTFCLYDQTPQQRHIVDSFRPDIKSNSSQRPRSEMNIASGIPTFFPLAMIQQDNNPYVQDDTMFIKIMVDFGDIPKMMLPYALSLNPALPIHIRQWMIVQEQQRRKKNAWEKDVYTSCDGSLFFSVGNFNENFILPPFNQPHSITSPVFFSAPNGYKMQIRLCLYGDGLGPRVHLSFHLTFSENSFDPILPRRFNYKISFCIYNQTVNGSHYIDESQLVIDLDNRLEYQVGQSIDLQWLARPRSPYIENDTLLIEVLIDHYNWSEELLGFYYRTDKALTTMNRFALTEERKRQMEEEIQHEEDYFDDILVLRR